MEIQTPIDSVINFLIYRTPNGKNIKRIDIGGVDIYLIDGHMRIKLSDGSLKVERVDGKDLSAQDTNYFTKLREDVEKLPKHMNFSSEKVFNKFMGISST